MANLQATTVTGGIFSSDGTESGSQSASATPIQGASSGLISANTINWLCGTYTTSGKSVIAYQDEQAGYYGPGKARVATLTGSTISYGTTVTFPGGNDADSGISIGYEQTENKVLICYGTNGNHQHSMVVGTVSGTSISFGSSTTLESGNSPDNGAFGPEGMVWVGGIGGDTTNRLVCCYTDQSLAGTGRVMTISGTTPREEQNQILAVVELMRSVVFMLVMGKL